MQIQIQMQVQMQIQIHMQVQMQMQTRSSWLNCALRDDEALYWVIIGHYEAVEVGN